MSLHVITHNEANEGHVNLAFTAAAVNAKGTFVYISGDYATTPISGADSKPHIGVVLTPAAAIGEKEVIATRFRGVVKDVRLGGTVAAGQYLKTAANSSTTQQLQLWVSGSDTPDEIVGMALEGGDSGDTIDVGLL